MSTQKKKKKKKKKEKEKEKNTLNDDKFNILVNFISRTE